MARPAEMRVVLGKPPGYCYYTWSSAILAGFMPCRPHGWCLVAWRCTAGRARRRFGQGKTQGVHFWGSADEVVLEAQKGLEAQSAMVDVFLAAMAGVTAADHERISEN